MPKFFSNFCNFCDNFGKNRGGNKRGKREGLRGGKLTVGNQQELRYSLGQCIPMEEREREGKKEKKE